jgi:UDP-N-acetylglucosamine--N-acetylmuramyl-(pentapeptide) pyrophosphoryl-undecaprenol N-acetylglucosamine transferase
MKPTIVFTGGGSAGHITPNLALIAEIKQEGWQIEYIGSKNSLEETMIKVTGISFHAISSGKLRRYFSWQNLIDPFYVLLGIIQAYRRLRHLKTDIVFSKGGFVAFPVVFAAWLNRIPVIAHESDISPGLANRLSLPFLSKLCITFPTALSQFKKHNHVTVTGTPIRQQLFNGSKINGLARCQFHASTPCLLVMGGGQGASKLNEVVRQSLVILTKHYQIIHLCGPNKVDTALSDYPNYRQFDYADDELPDLLAASDIIVSRAGANSLYEILALKKPHVLVPLSARISRGDQIENAAYFEKQGVSVVVDDDLLTAERLINAIKTVVLNQEVIVFKLNQLNIKCAKSHIITLIKEQLNARYFKTN